MLGHYTTPPRSCASLGQRRYLTTGPWFRQIGQEERGRIAIDAPPLPCYNPKGPKGPHTTERSTLP